MKKLFSKEVQIALVAIVGIIVLFFGMKFLKGMFLFSTDDSYYVEFDDISGVSASCPVYANGYRVGVVEDVIFNYDSQDKIVAVLGLDKQLRLPKASTAEIASDLLGNVKLELKFGPNPVDVMEPGDTLSGKKQGGALAKAADMLPQFEKMLPNEYVADESGHRQFAAQCGPDYGSSGYDHQRTEPSDSQSEPTDARYADQGGRSA